YAVGAVIGERSWFHRAPPVRAGRLPREGTRTPRAPAEPRAPAGPRVPTAQGPQIIWYTIFRHRTGRPPGAAYGAFPPAGRAQPGWLPAAAALAPRAPERAGPGPGPRAARRSPAGRGRPGGPRQHRSGGVLRGRRPERPRHRPGHGLRPAVRVLRNH